MQKIAINARFLADEYQFTGIGIYTRNLILALKDLNQKNEFSLICHRPKSKTTLKNSTLATNFKFIHLPESTWGNASTKKSWWEFRLVPQKVKQLNINAVHSPYPNLASFKSAKHVVTIHDVIPWRFSNYTNGILSSLYQKAAKHQVKKADHFLTVSNFSKQEISKHLQIDSGKITVTPNTVGTNFAQKPSLPLQEVLQKYSLPDQSYLIYVGGFDQRKNVELLIKVFEKEIAPNHNLNLIILGKNLYSTNLYLNTDSIQKGRIYTPGFVTEEEKRVFLEGALALIHLSNYEGFNIPILEALYCGTPAMVSDIPVHHEVAGANAFYLDINNEANLAQQINDFIGDTNLQQRLKEEGPKHAATFSWSQKAEKSMACLT